METALSYDPAVQLSLSPPRNRISGRFAGAFRPAKPRRRSESRWKCAKLGNLPGAFAADFGISGERRARSLNNNRRLRCDRGEAGCVFCIINSPRERDPRSSSPPRNHICFSHAAFSRARARAQNRRLLIKCTRLQSDSPDNRAAAIEE